MSRLRPMFAIICLCVAAGAASMARGDEALVLHYRFDEDRGDTARDLSAYGNDGKIVNAEYLKEFGGRRGVLRFGGKGSVLTCPQSESLRFGGDMSFEMWVRPNGPVKGGSGLIFGDRSNYALWMGYWHTLVFAYYGFNTELRSNETMVVPVERRLMSDEWSHVAVVVEYPRLRFYHNGELLRDAYMPIPGIQKRHKQPNRIGAWGDRCAPIDVDEFRLYRRALSAAEIAAHARGEEVPPARAEELFVEPHWYENRVVLRLSCKGADYKRHTVEMTLLDGNYKPVVTAKRAALNEAYKGCGRYVATVRFPLKGLEGKSLDGVARIFSPNGVLVKTVYRHVFLKKPAWVHTREGYSDDVMPPWTPLEATAKANGAVEIDVWGRRHLFNGAIFPRQIETRGEEILASPITLTGRANGKAIAWTNGAVKLKKASKTAASLEHLSKSATATLRTRMDIEYDGYMIFDCEVKALQDITLDALALEIPLRARYATLCFGSNVYPEKRKPVRIPMSVLHMGAVKKDLAFRFSPNIWLGNEDLGITWQAESDEDWRCADEQKAIEVLRRGEITSFQANWINVPTKLSKGQTLHYKFALQATPIKPLLRDAWDLRIVRCEPYGRSLSAPDATIRGKPAIQYYRETGMRNLFTTECDMWPYPMPIHDRYSRLLHRLNDRLHAAGIEHHNYQIHERFAAMAPEFDINGLYMSNRPLRTYSPGPHSPPGTPRPGPVGMDYGADSQGTVMYCAKSKALQDACVHALARRLDMYGDDGVYLDGTAAHIKACRNMLHGCGYRGKDGLIHPTYPVFANREFIKRIYTVVKQRRPEGVVDVHSWYFSPSQLAYADVLWTGEQWWHLRVKKTKYIPGELTLDMFRTAFTGRQLGVAAETLAYRLGPAMRVAAISLLHDIPVRPSTPGFDPAGERPRRRPRGRESYFDVMVKLWKMRDEFGAREAEKLFYWNNRDYVSVSPEKCYATLLKHPKNGVLAFVSNLSRNAQTVTVRFNLDKLGLRGKTLDAVNPLTGKAAAMTPDGKLSVPLGSEKWVYMWLRPTGRQKR